MLTICTLYIGRVYARSLRSSGVDVPSNQIPRKVRRNHQEDDRLDLECRRPEGEHFPAILEPIILPSRGWRRGRDLRKQLQEARHF